MDEKSHTNSTTQNNITDKEGLVSSGEFRMQIGNARTNAFACVIILYMNQEKVEIESTFMNNSIWIN